MNKIKRANLLEVSYRILKNKIYIYYIIDQEKKRKIIIKFPFQIKDFSKITHNHLAMACVVILSSLVLPKQINLNFALPQKKLFLQLIEILYNIRSYSEGLPFLSLPKIYAEKINDFINVDFNILNNSASLFWSGGVDSTYSLLLLRKNNYEIDLIHSNINIDQSIQEKKSIQILSKKLKVKPQFLYIDFPDLKTIGKKYSKKFSHFPFYNSIPFGRDVVHVFAGLYFNIKYNKKYICFGHERELWENYVYKNKVICRNDFQSEKGMLLLNLMLKNINPKIGLFSPIASLSKYKIYKELRKNKNIFSNVSYCYFSSKYNKCGKCSNCVLYNVLEKIFNNKQGSFKEMKNLLEMKNTTDEETFIKIFYLYFFSIIRKKQKNSLILQKFDEALLKNSKNDLIKKLNRVNKVKLTPRDFKVL